MLETNLVEEFHIFLFAINYGLILGVIYDLYRVIRHYSKPKKILSMVEDIVLWLIITFIFFMFLVKNTDGVIRGYIIIGFLVGYVFYLKIISKYNFPLLIKIFKLIFRLISEIINIILYPFRKIIKFSKKKFNKIYTIPKEVFKDARKYIKLTSKKK